MYPKMALARHDRRSKPGQFGAVVNSKNRRNDMVFLILLVDVSIRALVCVLAFLFNRLGVEDIVSLL